MTTIVAVFKNLLTPLSIFTALVLGSLAAFASGCIEYIVLHEWLSNQSGSTDWAILLVCVLEGSKVCFHFIEANLKQREASSCGLLSTVRMAKFALVGLSLFCTLVFAVNCFFGQVSEEIALAKNDAREAVLTEYSNKVEAAQAAYQDSYARETEPYLAQINGLQTQISLLSSSDTLTWARKSAILELTATLQTAREGYRREAKEIGARLDQKRKQDLDACEVWREQSLDRLVYDENSGQNQYLSVFLSTINDTLFHREHTRAQYFIWVIVIAVAVALLLEEIIVVSQTLLSSSSEELLRMFGKSPPLPSQLQQQMNNALNFLCAVIIALAVFLVYGCLRSILISPPLVIRVLVCYTLTFALTWHLGRRTIPRAGWAIQDAAKAHILDRVKDATADYLTNAVLSFGVFFLLSVFLGEQAAGMSVANVAVALGSLAGRCFFLTQVVPGPCS